MMKVIRLQAVFAFVFLFSCCAVVARQEDIPAPQCFQGTEDAIEIFEVSQDFEEPDMNLKIVRTNKVKISLSDVPFYTKVFCAYLYEDKLKKWYQAVTGYVNS